MSIQTSLIVVNYNGAALLPSCIESALATTPPDCELIVVDNASTDGSRALLAGYGERVRVVPSPRNIGFGRACNLGAAAARGDLLVFLNPDVTFPAGWLAPLAEAARDERYGLICPQPLAPGEPIPVAGGPALADLAQLPGCGLTARRAVWLALGGFDEAFFLYWEDTELCWRAWLLGWRVGVAPRSFVYHEKSATTRVYGRWDAERARNSLYTYLKLMRWSVALGYALRLLLVCAVKALRWPRLAPGLLHAWWWNAAHLGQTMRARRALAARRASKYTELERHIRRQLAKG
jgi:N-acetylglucosaminyl-diphospho-decaprenol L-rhamnosyltransferase